MGQMYLQNARLSFAAVCEDDPDGIVEDIAKDKNSTT